MTADGLVDFLLACIGEDEADAHHVRRVVPFIAEDGYPSFAYDSNAKRRIVKRHTGKHVCPEPEDDEWATHYIAGQPVVIVRPCGDLRDLASVYADREGFREEWRA